jgi:hypothetical protein
MPRQSAKIATLALSLIFCLGCSNKPSDSAHGLAQEVWSRHEAVIVKISRREKVDLKSFEEACLFFENLTGITVPGDHSPVIDWFPTKDTPKALQPLRQWYADHQDQLVWDPASKKVILQR